MPRGCRLRQTGVGTRCDLRPLGRGHGVEPERVRDCDGRFTSSLRHFDWRVFLRPRTLIYAGLWSAIGIGMVRSP